MSTVDERRGTIEKTANWIVEAGFFVPSTQIDTIGSEAVGVWKPLWGDPEVQQHMASIRETGGDRALEAEAKRQIEEAVDRLVRERMSERDREEAYAALRPRYGVPHTPLEIWVAGLLSGERSTGSGLDWIAEDMEAWIDAVEASRQTADYRVALKLSEPPPQAVQGPWLLELGLQPTDEPWRFIPAKSVWAQASPDPIIRRRRYPAAQERLAGGIARAAAVYPPLAHALPAHAPTLCRLSADEAAELFERAAQALETAGHAVILPAWWSAPAPLGVALRILEPPQQRPSALAPPEASGGEPGGSRLGLSALLSYRSELTLFGSMIPDEQLQALGGETLPMAQIGGRWFRLTNREKQAINRFLSRERSGSASWAEVIHTGLLQDAQHTDHKHPLPMAASAAELPITGLFADRRLLSYIHSLQELLANTNTTTQADLQPQPEAFRGTLRDYQRRGFTWLTQLRGLGFGACLADDMGLGKTVQWIAYALRNEQERRRTGKPMLLICPTSVLGNWQRELERFAPNLQVHLHYGAQRLKGAAFQHAAAQHDIVLTSYSTALRDKKSFASVQWDAVTLDEAQYIKNSGTQLARFVRALDSVHRIAMTGTPIENRLSDLWSVSEWINPGYLGSERSFKSRYATPIERAKDEAAAEKLHTLIRPFILRRVKTDPTVIDDLPEKLEIESYCALTQTQARLYRQTVDNLANTLSRTEGMARRGAILSAITRLKQICNEPAHALKRQRIAKADSGKLFRLEQLLTESASIGDRCVIFTQYASMAHLLQPYLEASLNERVAVMTGRTASKDREQIIREFQEDDLGPRIIVLSLKTGGFGLNLTRANRLIHYDRWWNPAAERQATDRIFRIGQTRNVEVWKLITKGTLEEAIDQLLKDKERLVDEVVGTGERWLTEWSDTELTELLTLRHEIVVEDERD